MRWLIALAVLAGSAASNAADRVRVMGFAGSSNWPIFVAQERQLFARQALDVELSPAPSSAAQIASLREGRIDIAMTAMDNLLPYGGELFAFLGVHDGGRISLIVAPAIAAYAELKGRSLGVDAVDSGYAFVLMEMLERAGLPPGSYDLLSVGGSRERFAALRAGKVLGALLNAPNDAEAEAIGFRRLGTSADVLKRYQGSVGATRRAWAAANADTLLRYIRAYVAAADWLFEPANRDEAMAILQRRLPRLSTEAAARSYDELIVQGSMARRAVLDIEGVREVLRLRGKFWRGALEEPGRYYDLSYHRKALSP